MINSLATISFSIEIVFGGFNHSATLEDISSKGQQDMLSEI